MDHKGPVHQWHSEEQVFAVFPQFYYSFSGKIYNLVYSIQDKTLRNWEIYAWSNIQSEPVFSKG